MQKFRKSIVVIALLCIVTGIIIAGIGFLSGGFHPQNAFSIFFRQGEMKSSKEEKNIAIQEFTSLDLQIAYGDICVERGNDFELRIENIPDEYYTIEEKNQKLTLIYDQDFLSGFNFGNLDYKITVSIPKDVELESVVIDSKMGDVEVLDLQSKYLEIDQNMGEIVVLDSLINGDLRLNQQMGDIEFRGYVRGHSIFDNSMGDIDIEILDQEEDYAYDLATSMGDVEVQNRSQSDGINSKISGGSRSAPYLIEASDSMGDINLDFR